MSRHVARLASHVSVERLTLWNRQSGPACLALATDLIVATLWKDRAGPACLALATDLIVVPVLELRKTWETWQVPLVAPASKHDYYNDGARNVPQL